MENYRMDLLCLSMGIFLLLCAKADAYDYNPLGNVNLSPFSQMRSAWECMQNFSEACTSSKDVLKLEGVVNVSKAEVPEYCKSGGCGEHTKHVLTCVFYVKRDFTFANGATVHNITGTIERGCTTNSSKFLAV
ncbi:uncharacterized protein LOC110010149 [Jatropha curcas]|uniref:uncharacterized protein LOC110010149 n=1 Tax=Jatropha curcas TaxID=180498 RepID=UPI00189331FB|nr:uncharacterized protein LOC110010149 [Jatropha curcas]